MFYQFSDSIHTVSPDSLSASSEVLTAGYVTSRELPKVAEHFGFSEQNVDSCASASPFFRSGVEVYDDYTFTELRIMDASRKDEDCVALFLRKNLLLVVDVEDKDGSTKQKFESAVHRYPASGMTAEKLLYAFLDALLCGDVMEIEKIGNHLSALEENLLLGNVEKDFNADILRHKKLLLRLHSYYEQILDITEAVTENENDIFADDRMFLISNIEKRVERFREDTDSLKNTLEHLQDAYSTFLDAKMNNTMKIITVITTIFFPLTIIVGWYGMNFDNMPELHWSFGYIYVILLSIVVVAALFFYSKKKKWF